MAEARELPGLALVLAECISALYQRAGYHLGIAYCITNDLLGLAGPMSASPDRRVPRKDSNSTLFVFLKEAENEYKKYTDAANADHGNADGVRIGKGAE